MVMMILGVIMIVFGLYDYMKPNSKLLRFINRRPKNDSVTQEVRFNGQSGIFGGILFIAIGVIVILLRN